MHKCVKSCSEVILPFHGLEQLYEEKLQKSHISVSSVQKFQKSCSELIWPFYGFLQLYEVKLQKYYISVNSVHKFYKSCSEADLSVLLFITTVWSKTSKISYLREFSGKVSQIVFSSHLTVLQLRTTVGGKNFKNLISPGIKWTGITN